MSLTNSSTYIIFFFIRKTHTSTAILGKMCYLELRLGHAVSLRIGLPEIHVFTWFCDLIGPVAWSAIKCSNAKLNRRVCK